MREFDNKTLNWLLAVWLIMGVCFHLYTAAFGVFEAWMQRLIHLTWVFPLAFIYWPFSKKSPKKKSSILRLSAGFSFHRSGSLRSVQQ